MVSFFKIEKTTFRSVFANNSVFNLHFMKVSTENDNNFGYEKNTIVVDNMPLMNWMDYCEYIFNFLIFFFIFRTNE
jgi:hypothetical protein